MEATFSEGRGSGKDVRETARDIYKKHRVSTLGCVRLQYVMEVVRKKARELCLKKASQLSLRISLYSTSKKASWVFFFYRK